MVDEMVLQAQNWLNATYTGRYGYNEIVPDGKTGWQTMYALTRALQIELGIGEPSDNFGNGTLGALVTYGNIGKNQNNSNANIVKIIQSALFCKGYNSGAITGTFGDNTEQAIINLKTDIGLVNPNGDVTPKVFKALLTMDAYVLLKDTPLSRKIRTIQQWLNNRYNHRTNFFFKPCDGIFSRGTHTALIYAIQYEEGLSDAVANGNFGPTTKSNLPILSVGSSDNTTKFVHLLQAALCFNGYEVDFDGVFGNGTKGKVQEFQNFVKLTADGVCGQQTWASLMCSTGDPSRTTTACDTRFEITDNAAKLLVKNGYQIVGRYIVGGDFKELRENEPEVIFRNGLKFFPIYQANGTSESDYTTQTGEYDANQANIAIRKHKIPKGSTIYFVVDFDCLDYQITNSIIPYFKALAREFNVNYNIGIYATRNAGQRVCDSVLRVNSCFVSDMSTGYSGNLGYCLPSNWNYDQIANITLSDSVYGSLEIDKVVYSGIIPAISQLKEEEEVPNDVLTTYNNILNIYDVAMQYSKNDKKKSNLLVLQYIRKGRYGDTKSFGFEENGSSIKWDVIAGEIDSLFCKTVDLLYNDLNFNFSDSPINPAISHDLPHWAATLNALLHYIGYEGLTGLDEIVDAYAGWAGDMITFADTISAAVSKGITNDYEQWARNNICQEIDESLENKFDTADYIDDLDAYNIYSMIKLKGYSLPEAFYYYYIEKSVKDDKCAYEHRATNFIEYMGASRFSHLCELLTSSESPIKELKAMLSKSEQRYIDAAMDAFKNLVLTNHANEK